MSETVTRILRTLVAAAAIGMLPHTPGAFAQATPPATAPSSVLPSGGGQALLDTADVGSSCSTTSPGCSRPSRTSASTELRAQHHDARQARDAAENSRDHDRLRAERPERSADAGDPPVRAARGLRAAQGRGERLGQRRLRRDGARHRHARR